MSKKQYDYFDVSKEKKADWEKICPVDEYRVLSGSQITTLLPEKLTNQYDSVIVVASGSNDGTAYYMMNGNRVDFKDQAIDQMPFALAFIGDEPVISGSLVQHGDWTDRTVPMPSDFQSYVQASGIGALYPLHELPQNNSGSIEELIGTSQEAAFKDVFASIRPFVDDAKQKDEE